LDTFVSALEECEDCKKFGKKYEETLKFRPKPSIYFNIYRNWRPSKVKALFIAEAPPWKPKYFYSPDIKASFLRKMLFNQLQIPYLNKNGLEVFKARGYFFTDTIKCRLRKQKSKPPIQIIRNCVRNFLSNEIRSLNPEKIILLGKTAKQGLEQLQEFKALRKYGVKKIAVK
jgi:hypothetical protein